MSFHRTQNMFKQLDCCLCGQHFNGANALESHLASIHVMYMAYECDFCMDALFPSDFALREHYTKIHNKKSFVVKYRVSPDLDERRELLQRLVDRSTHKTNGALQQNKVTSLETNSNTSQLLVNCTSLLQKQLLANSHFLSNFIKKEQCDELEENTDSDDHFRGDGAVNELSFFDLECKALTGQKRAFSEEDKPITKMNDRLSPLAMNLDDVSLTMNMEQSNYVNSKIKVSPIKKHSKKQQNGQQNVENDQMQANCSQGSNEEAKQQKGPMVKCSECKRMVGQYRNSMLIHVSTHHCDQAIFECLADGCGKKWYSISARTKEHIEAKHGGNYKFLQDNRSLLLPFLRSTAHRLFPGDY